MVLKLEEQLDYISKLKLRNRGIFSSHDGVYSGLKSGMIRTFSTLLNSIMKKDFKLLCIQCLKKQSASVVGNGIISTFEDVQCTWVGILS